MRRHLVPVLLAVLLGALLPAVGHGAVIVGAQTVQSGADANNAGVAEAFTTTASASGQVARIGVYVDAGTTATRMVAGIYADASGRPGALLGQGSLTAPTSGAWNEVTLPAPVTVTAGTTYWLTILGPSGGGILRFRDRCCGGVGTAAETSQQANLTALPATWTRGTVYRDGPLAAYGASVDGPVLLVTPATLTFTGVEGGAAPAGQQITITNGGSGALTWTASDDAPWLGVAPATGTAPGSATVTATTAGLTPGTRTGTVTVTAPGATGSPRTVGVTLTVSAGADTTPPTVSLTAPAAGATLTGTTTVTATAADAVGVAGVRFRLDGADLGAEDTTAPYSVSWNTTTASNGAHTLTAIARDAAGNTATAASVAVTVANTVPDTTPPAVSITAPVAGATLSGTSTVVATATDAVGVAGVRFRLDGADLGVEDTAAPYSVSWDTTAVANGAHTLTAIARDAAGNSATAAAVPVTVANAAGPSEVGSWSPVQSWPVVAVHSLLQPNGTVLVFDAFDASPNSHRVWNPATGLFVAVPYNANIFCGGHTTLGDGRSIIVGGHVEAYVGTRDTTLFDSTTGTWSRGTDMFRPRWYPTATTLPDGRVLSVGGDAITRGLPIGRTYDSSATVPEIYDPEADTWTLLSQGARETRLYPFMFVIPDGRVIDAGPFTQSQYLDLATGTWTAGPVSPIEGASAAMYRPGRILKSGTASDPDYPNLAVTDRAVVLDTTQANPAWRDVGRMAFPRSFHNLTVLPDGDVLAVGGATRSDGVDQTHAVRAAEVFDAATETWRTLASAQRGRLYHSTSLLLPDGRVLVAGGGRLPGSTALNEENAEIFSPPYLFRGPRPTVTSAPDIGVYDTSFTVATPDAARVESVALVRLGSVTHSVDMGQSYVPLTFTRGAGQLLVQAPASPSIATPGVYMLFVVDDQGVPSVAEFIRFPVSVDDVAPTVQVTAPAAGATVSGTATLTATAADDTAVAGVRFRVDGTAVGAEDTTAPYSVPWASGSVADGPHVVTAVARDTAGNQTVSAGVTIQVANGAPAGGPVAAYGFEEASGTAVTDSSTRGNNGTSSGATRITTGRYGRALSFDGVNDLVTVPDSSSLDLTTGMTVEAWVYPTALGTIWRTVVLKESPGYFRYALYASMSANRPSGHAFVTSDLWAEGTGPLALNAWTHLATTFDGQATRLYVNGQLAGTRAVSGAMSASTNPLRIGGNTIWSDEWFRGRIDEVRVYDRALSAAEIQADLAAPVVP